MKPHFDMLYVLTSYVKAKCVRYMPLFSYLQMHGRRPWADKCFYKRESLYQKKLLEIKSQQALLFIYCAQIIAKKFLTSNADFQPFRNP